MNVRPVAEADRPWIAEQMTAHFGATRMVSRERLHLDIPRYPGVVAEGAGYVLFDVVDGVTEVVVVHAVETGVGVGRALLDAAVDEARRQAWQRLWLVTTNDNVDAIAFYQRVGWEWVAFHRDAVTRGRALKPEIPMVGANGIQLRHEIEFEAPLSNWR